MAEQVNEAEQVEKAEQLGEAERASETKQPTEAEQLAALIEGKTDDEINAFVSLQGADTVLNPIFDGMQQRFLPDKAAGRAAVIQYDIVTADGTRSYQLTVADGTCALAEGAEQPATVTLILTTPDFLRLITGKLNGMQAFMSGKLKLKGDMMLAQSMQTWFDQSR
jgi:putative sterol carrier protein